MQALAAKATPGAPAWPSRCSLTSAWEFAGRGTAEVINELPDLDLAVRALAAPGPSWPALQHAGDDRFAQVMFRALRPLHVEGLGVRIVSEFGWIIGQVPPALTGCPGCHTKAAGQRKLDRPLPSPGSAGFGTWPATNWLWFGGGFVPPQWSCV